jgi:hypothetical protein
LKISSPSRILASRACDGLALRSGRPTLPGWASPSDLCRSSPIFKCGARQRAAASWLRGPAGADGVLSPWYPPTDLPRSVGTTKKPPRPFGRGGFSFFELLLHHHRPRARLFDGSIPGGLAARRRGIRTHEQRPSLPMEDLHRWPLVSDAG